MPEDLLLVVWNSVGLCVGLVCGSKVFTLRWVGLGWVSRLGWVEETGPSDKISEQHFEHLKLGSAHDEPKTSPYLLQIGTHLVYYRSREEVKFSYVQIQHGGLRQLFQY